MPLAQPLRFAPLVFPKVWGGDRLRPFLGDDTDLPADPIGEVWQLSDNDGESSVVLGGDFDGRSLRGLMMSEERAILGEAEGAPAGYFPLHVKLLDSAANLSVQVHPDATAAKALGFGARPKEEAWYVLHAEPGSELYLGLKPDVTATAFAARASSPDVVDLLQVYPVHAGQFVHVPAGTVHAIGAGITLAEVQQNSTTTYRMFDWGRMGLDNRPREIQLEEALKSIDYQQRLRGPFEAADATGPLVDSSSFRIDLLVQDTGRLAGGCPAVLVVLEGKAQLAWEGCEEPRAVEQGQTWLLPADLAQREIVGASKLFRALLVQPGKDDRDE